MGLRPPQQEEEGAAPYALRAKERASARPAPEIRSPWLSGPRAPLKGTAAAAPLISNIQCLHPP